MPANPLTDLPFEGVFEVVAVDGDTVTILAQRLFNRNKQQLDVPRHHIKENDLELKPGSFGCMSLWDSGDSWRRLQHPAHRRDLAPIARTPPATPPLSCWLFWRVNTEVPTRRSAVTPSRLVQLLCGLMLQNGAKEDRSMTKRRRHTPEQIIRKLAEGNKLLGAGTELAEVCRHLQIAESTWHRWLAQYGGMKANDAKRLKELEIENARLKRLVADAELDKAMLKELAEGNF